MRQIFLFLAFSFGVLQGFSQTTIKGILVDTVSDSKVPRAAVTIIDHKDSTLIKFTRTDANGEFSLNGIANGKYVVLVAHPLYAGYSDQIEVNGQPEVNLGSIQMLSEQMLLKELTVLSSDAIKIKGDTIEYTADSFKVKQDATVEDLFKKLPGIQVNKNGEIIAQGKRVEKVLVDGDEFFSDDPTVATQNLKASSVDKVQVYEKKDEQSGSTDQGAQTINITLKEDAKKGYFGKLKSGAGTNDDLSHLFYNNEAMINKFSSRRKISGYFVHSNSGKTGLTRQESSNYAGKTNNGWMDEEGGFTFQTSSSDDEYESFGANYQGQGIPQSINTGANFDNKWKKGKHHINGAYQFKQIDNDATSEVNSENYLQDTVFFKNENTNTSTRNNRHNFNLNYDVKTDSLSTLKWTVVGSYTENKKDNFYESHTLNEDNDSVNSTSRVLNSNSKVFNLNSTLNYFKKFKKVDRSLNLTAEYGNKSTDIESQLFSSNNIFLDSNVLLLNTITDQHKTIDRVEQTIKGGIAYKEPLAKTTILEMRYMYNYSGQVADRFTFDDLNNDETYSNRIDSLSSKYVYDFQSHRTGLILHFKKDKVSFKAGADISKQFYNQVDKLNDTTLNRDFLNFFPTSTFVYAFNKMTQFRLTYNGYTTQPGISQIQPLIDNTDPFNISTGNPDLNPSFTHEISAMYNNNQVLKGRYLFLWSNFNYVSNAIVSSSTVDEYNRNQMSYANASGNINANLAANYYIELKKIDGNINFGGNANYSKNINLINTVTNITQNTFYSAYGSAGKDIKEWFDAGVNYNYSYNISGSSIQENAKIKYWTQEIGADVEFIVKKRFIISSDLNYNLRQKTETFNQNNNVLIWNADLDFKVFKKRNGVFTLHVNDILNQNLGFQRYATAYSITQTRYNVIKRYWMLSFTWNFNSNKEKPAIQEEEW
jgi:Outer membrane protein beta-barrel family/Carboxypeptidase regulatory-like domain